MRGDIPFTESMNNNMTDAVVSNMTADTTATVSGDAKSNMADNASLTKYSIWWLLIIAFLYFVWGYFQNKKVKEQLKPANIEANLHNIIVTTVGVVIGVNMLLVLLTKLASFRIPIISRFATTLLPFIHF